MKIKRKMLILNTLPVALVAGLILILLLSYSAVSETMMKNRQGKEILQRVFKLNMLTANYIMYPFEHPKKQWFLQHEAIQDLLNKMKYQQTEKKLLLKNIRNSHREINILFQELTSIYDAPKSAQNISQSIIANEERLKGQLLINTDAIISETSRLNRLNYVSLMKYLKKTSFIIVSCLLFVMITMVIVSYILGKSIFEPILKLYKATKIISGGNLDYRMDVTSSDELGQLSSAFNDMSSNLQNSRKVLTDEIEERKDAEKALQKEKDKLQRYLDISAVMVVMIGADQNVTLINKKGCNILGYTEEEIIGRNWFDNFLPERVRDKVRFVYEKLMAGEVEPLDHYENSVITKSGEEKLIAWYNTIFRDENGHIAMTLGSGVDITETRKTEEQIKASLKEKEVLLQEIHHRVKNNMTVITSLLKLQSKHAKDLKNRDIFNDSINRIQSMAMIHEKLYKSENLSHIDFKSYLQEMAVSMFQSYGPGVESIQLEMDTEEMVLELDTAIPCGLIVNELVSNALKHAFPGNMQGILTISLHKSNNNIEILVSDTGIGISHELDLDNIDSLGLTLVRTLARQLNGEVSISNNNGTEVRVTFRRSGE